MLRCIGLEAESDIGGCYEYLYQYAEQHVVDLASTAIQFLSRTCEAVALILQESEEG